MPTRKYMSRDQNLFEVVGDSLPYILEQIPYLDDDDKFEQVSQALRMTSEVYKNHMRNRNVRMNWDNPIYQCAYVFLYFVKHSYLVYEALLANVVSLNSTWKDISNINVCSFGGGPGSDISGIIKFFNETSLGSSLQCCVLDLYPEWQNAWNTVWRNLYSRLSPVNVTYGKFDLVNSSYFTAKNVQRIANADLVTFVKSFSTVSNEHSVRQKVLPKIMKTIKPGCFVLFIDNSPATFQNGLFKQVAENCGLSVLHDEAVSETTLSLSSSSTMRYYSRVFDYSPMRKCSVTVYLFQKPLPVPPRVLSSYTTRHQNTYHGHQTHSNHASTTRKQSTSYGQNAEQTHSNHASTTRQQNTSYGLNAEQRNMHLTPQSSVSTRSTSYRYDSRNLLQTPSEQRRGHISPDSGSSWSLYNNAPDATREQTFGNYRPSPVLQPSTHVISPRNRPDSRSNENGKTGCCCCTIL